MKQIIRSEEVANTITPGVEHHHSTDEDGA